MFDSTETNHEIKDLNPESFSSYSSSARQTHCLYIGPAYSVPHTHRLTPINLRVQSPYCIYYGQRNLGLGLSPVM
jgi:hypothetical protein